MSLTLLGWLLLASLIGMSALLIFQLRSRATRLALLSQLRSPSWRFGQDVRGTPATLIVPAAAFLAVAGIGAGTSYLKPPDATGSGGTISFSGSLSASNGEMLASLKNYTRSIGTKEPASRAPAGKLLPDVNTMIERLVARLKTTPGDIKGWRMLGWSYFHTGRYKEAAAAYARAVELDPNSAEIKRSYEDAKAKGTLQTEAVDKRGGGRRLEKRTKSETMAPHEHDAAIRLMVDGLAERLESSPGDAESWTRLMRSRVVLGERRAAATAFRKALEVFKDDSAALSKITAVGIDLGLRPE